MNILVKNVEKGAEYNENVYDYWVNAEMKNGENIKLFDSVPFDLSDKIMKTLECLVLVGFIDESHASSNENFQIIKGKYIGEYRISKDWLKIREDIYQEKWHGISTENGVFLVSENEIENVINNNGDNVNLGFGRFDLVGIK